MRNVRDETAMFEARETQSNPCQAHIPTHTQLLEFDMLSYFSSWEHIYRLFNEIAVMARSNQPAAATRGHLIVVEGLDRSGKTTQCEMLCNDINGTDREVVNIKFPGESFPRISKTKTESLPQIELNRQAR